MFLFNSLELFCSAAHLHFVPVYRIRFNLKFSRSQTSEIVVQCPREQSSSFTPDILGQTFARRFQKEIFCVRLDKKKMHSFSKLSAKLQRNRRDNTLSSLKSPIEAHIAVEEHHLEDFLDCLCTFVAQSSKRLSILAQMA